MNKQRYLAELRRLLVFMNDEDRDEAVRRCAEAFDAAGPEGEALLLADMGSPTKMAIGLSRGYEPGKIPDIIPKTAIVRPKAAEPVEAPKAAEELLPPEPEITWTELPAFDAKEAGPATEGEPAPETEAAPAEAAPAEAAPEGEPTPEAEAAPAEAPKAEPEREVPAQEIAPAPEAPAETPETPADGAVEWQREKPSDDPEAPEESPEEPAEAQGPRTVIERTMPLGLGIPLFILVFGALGIPLGILCLALSLVLLVPGCAILFGAYLVGVGGLWCTSYMADAALLFGAAFIVLAIGLLVLWFGIWLAVKLWTVYVKGVGWIAGELLGRKVTADE